jgi:type IV pilus assembly protein PilX
MKHEKGSVLLISLVMLLILTIVGIASISGVSMTEKMTNSQRDYDIAFEMAEAALVQGETWIDDYSAGFNIEHLSDSCSGTTCFTENCNAGLCFRGEYLSEGSLCELDSSGTPVWQSEAIWDSNAATYSRNIAAVEPPKYLVEFLCLTAVDPTSQTSDLAYIYRITSLAYGTHPETRVMLQSTYKVEKTN